MKTLTEPRLKLPEVGCPSTLDEKAFMQNVPNLSAVGSLMYLATCTRPDIAYAVSLLARFNSNPGKKYLTRSQTSVVVSQRHSGFATLF